MKSHVECRIQEIGKEQELPGACWCLGDGSWLPCLPSPTIMQLNSLAMYHDGRHRAGDEDSGLDSYLPNEDFLLFDVCSSMDVKRIFCTRRCENSV